MRFVDDTDEDIAYDDAVGLGEIKCCDKSKFREKTRLPGGKIRQFGMAMAGSVGPAIFIALSAARFGAGKMIACHFTNA